MCMRKTKFERSDLMTEKGTRWSIHFKLENVYYIEKYKKRPSLNLVY